MKWADIPKMTATLQAWLSDGVEAPAPKAMPHVEAAPKPKLSSFLDKYKAAGSDEERAAILEPLTPVERAKIVGAASRGAA
jgi:hypothetical protein